MNNFYMIEKMLRWFSTFQQWLNQLLLFLRKEEKGGDNEIQGKCNRVL